MKYIANENLIYIKADILSECINVPLRTIQHRCSQSRYICRTIKSNVGRGGKSYEILVSSLEPEVQLKIFKAHPELLDTNLSNLNSNLIQSNFAAENQYAVTSAIRGEAAFSLENKANNALTYTPGAFSYQYQSNQSAPFSLSFDDAEKTNGQGLENSPSYKLSPALFLPAPNKNLLSNNISGAPNSLINTSDNHLISGAPFLSPVRYIPESAKREALAKADLINHWQTYRKDKDDKAKADKDFESMYNSQLLSVALFSVLGKVSVKSLYRWKKSLDDSQNDYRALVPAYEYANKEEYNGELSQVEQKAFLAYMLRPSKPSIGNAYRVIKYLKDKLGIDKMHSEKTYRRYCKQFVRNNYDMWVLMREGEKALSEKVLKYNERDISLINAGDVFIADGHTLDFQVINPFTGKPCRATLVCYQDWKSSDIAGYEIMVNENTQCIASALRNSILRFGRTPAIAYQDNGKAFRGKYFHGSDDFNDCGLRGVFTNLGILTMFARPYNAKAKPVERFFREFTQICESGVPSYVGNTIENKPAHMKRNEKFHKTMHEIVNHNYVPTIDEAKQLIDSYLVFYRSQPCPHVKGKTIGEVFNEAKGSGVNPEELDTLMMAQAVRKIGRNGIKFLGTQYYNEKLYGIKDKVVIKYSLADLSSIKIYSMSGEFMCEAQTDMLLHPAAAYLGTETDLENVRHAIKEVAKAKRATLQKAKRSISGHLPMTDWEQKPLLEDKNKNKNIKKITGKSVKNVEKPKEKYVIDHYADIPIILPDKPAQKYSLF